MLWYTLLEIDCGRLLSIAVDCCRLQSKKKHTQQGRKHGALQKISEPLGQLQDQYEKRLTDLQKEAGQTGDLEAVLEIKKEIEGFRSGSHTDATHSAELRQSQKVYRDTLSRRRVKFRLS